MPARITVSIVVPALNEAGNLPRTLAAARRVFPAAEVIVVDANSTDGTAAAARSHGARVVHSTAGNRAVQMNIGAEHGRGRVLLFLHADTILPPSAGIRLRKALADPSVVGGAFARRFDSPSWFLGWTCRLADIRGKVLGWYLGDQAMFVRRGVFRRIGGFPELRCLEDLEMSRRMKQAGRTVLLDPPVVSSGRRFGRRGAVLRTLMDFCITVRYFMQPDRFAAEKHRAGRDARLSGNAAHARGREGARREKHQKGYTSQCPKSTTTT